MVALKPGDQVFGIVKDDDARLYGNGGVATNGIMYLSKDALDIDPVLTPHEAGHWGNLPDIKDENLKDSRIMYNKKYPSGTASEPHPDEYSDYYKGTYYAPGVRTSGDNKTNLKMSDEVE